MKVRIELILLISVLILSACEKSIVDKPSELEREMEGRWELYELKDSLGVYVSASELPYKISFERKILSRVHPSKGESWADSIKFFYDDTLSYSENIHHIMHNLEDRSTIIYSLNDGNYISLRIFYDKKSKKLEVSKVAKDISDIEGDILYYFAPK